MKKILAIALALCMVLSLGVMACAEPAKEITLWTYPIGAWGNAETVEGLMADFEIVLAKCNEAGEITEIRVHTMEEILPDSFGPENLS